MLYMVSYDSTIAQDAKGRIDEVLRSMTRWWHHLDSTWIVSSDQGLEDITNHLHSVAGSDDKFLVVNITFCNYNGWLPSKAWDWLRGENLRERDRVVGTHRSESADGSRTSNGVGDAS